MKKICIICALVLAVIIQKGLAWFSISTGIFCTVHIQCDYEQLWQVMFYSQT